MATSSTKTANPMAYNIMIETDLTSTMLQDVGNGSITIYSMHLNNAANSGSVYVKCYNNTSATTGSDNPELIFRLFGTQVLDVVFPAGLTMSTGLCIACVDSVGTAGTTSPTNDVKIRLVTS
tara:strand:- start:16386 stop:16751 length:366 start_codon:yes stop_codon:yes gene_type:complete